MEGRLKEANAQKGLLKKAYDNSLQKEVKLLNATKKSLEYERERYLGLKELQTPKTVQPNCFEDVLINSIRKSKEFQDCVKYFKMGELRSMNLSYDISKLKKINQEIEKIQGVGYTRPIESGHKSSEELREKVEERLEGETLTRIDEVTGKGYTYSDFHIGKRGSGK